LLLVADDKAASRILVDRAGAPARIVADEVSVAISRSTGEADFSGIGGVTVRVRGDSAAGSADRATQELWETQGLLIAQRYLGSVAAMPFLFRSIRLERIEHERRRTCHALQA
jgi:hypothetical protein